MFGAHLQSVSNHFKPGAPALAELPRERGVTNEKGDSRSRIHFWTILSADIDISHIESQYNTYIHTYVFYYFNIYLELRYGNNNCRFHETSPFSVLRRSSILIS